MPLTIEYVNSITATVNTTGSATENSEASISRMCDNIISATTVDPRAAAVCVSGM